MSNMAYLDHLLRVDIPAWQQGWGDWFTIQLFSLMAKADGGNFARLKDAFPVEAEAFEMWQKGDLP